MAPCCSPRGGIATSLSQNVVASLVSKPWICDPVTSRMCLRLKMCQTEYQITTTTLLHTPLCRLFFTLNVLCFLKPYSGKILVSFYMWSLPTNRQSLLESGPRSVTATCHSTRNPEMPGIQSAVCPVAPRGSHHAHGSSNPPFLQRHSGFQLPRGLSLVKTPMTSLGENTIPNLIVF